MDVKTVKFNVRDREVAICGYPELEGRKGFLAGDGIAFFYGEGWNNYELYLANTQTGKIRKIVTTDGTVLIDDSEIDYETISKKCKNGYGFALRKMMAFGKMGRWNDFKNGLCAFTWTLYPDGRYFEDEDGFGGKSNNEECVYAIIDTNLNIVEPFRPIKDVAAYLEELRNNNCKSLNNRETMKTRIFNLIIIDESGSMQSIKKEAIDSVNETIQTIRSAQKKHEEQEHYISLVSFNDNVKSIYTCVPVNEVMELTEDTYRPDCCTALYDAMGISLNALRKRVAEDDKVLVTVVTDGCENASKEYSGKSIKALIDELKAKGWVFAYIGANHDVEAVAATISITNVMKFEATSHGTAAMGAKLDSARARLFDSIADNCFCPSVANIDFFEEN